MWSCSCGVITRVARLTDVRRFIKKPGSMVEHHGVFYLDVEFDEVIGDSEPHIHGCECGCEPDDPDAPDGYYPESVLYVNQRDVVRVLVGHELSEYV